MTTAARNVVLPVPRSLVQVVVGLWFLALVVALISWWSSPTAQYLAVGAGACLVVSMPFLDRDHDLISPWSLVALTVYVGCGLRGAAIAWGIDGSRTIDGLFLLGRSPDYFLRPNLYFLVGITALTLGYWWVGRPRGESPARTRRPMWDAYRFSPSVHWVVAFSALVGFVAFVLYVQRTGGLNLGALSTKRTTISGLELDSSYQSHGELRALNDLSTYALWIAVAHLTVGRQKLTAGRGILLAGLAANAALLPAYASSRSSLAYTLIIAVAIRLCLGHERGRGRVIVRIGAVVLVALAVLSLLRVGARSAAVEEYRGADVLVGVADAMIYNRNLADHVTSSHIINAVPDRLEHAYGTTVANWLVAPIPRSVWPDKPIVSAGPTIGVAVFGTTRSGVPPGVVAEGYWNFGIIGLVLFPLMSGWVLRALYERARPRLRDHPAVALIYCACVLKLGGSVVSGTIGAAGFDALIVAVVLTPLLVLSRARADEVSYRGGDAAGGSAAASSAPPAGRPTRT